MLEFESLRSKRWWTSFSACCTALCTSGISILETTSKLLSGIGYSRSPSEDSDSGGLISNPRLYQATWMLNGMVSALRLLRSERAGPGRDVPLFALRSEEHTSELQSL